MQADDHAALVRGAEAFGIALDEQQLAAFLRYRELLLDWNTHINLTSVTDPHEVLARHFLDSLSVAAGVPAGLRARGVRLLDVGSGAGFPGLPLAIAFPRWRVTALEATGKKVRFLEHVVSELRLTNVRPLAGRAEELARQTNERGRYDVVAARAVAALPTLLEYCQPFARPGGVVIAPKKGEIAAELADGRAAAHLLGGHMDEPLPLTVPGLEDGRLLVVVHQKQACPAIYPRAAGAPQKRPLGRDRGTR
jgi:16S rRNA (guanine527-N7)-methyltransferase